MLLMENEMEEKMEDQMETQLSLKGIQGYCKAQ